VKPGYLAACCDVDLGDLAQALDRLDVISAAAKAAADPPLAAIALDGQSHFHVFRGHHERALDLVKQGLHACAPADSPGTVAFMHMRVAEEHLVLGHRVQAVEAWAAAEDRYAVTDLESDRNWLRLWFTRDCFDSVRSVIFASTGRDSDAAEAAERVVTRVDGARGKTDAVALFNAAIALGALGKFGQAAEAGRYGLQATRASEARGCLPRAESLAKLLAPRRSQDPVIRKYLDEFNTTRDKLANMPHPRLSVND
jgi:hypothetical protein